MNCPFCGKEAKIIATSRDFYVYCETALTEIVTENGRIFKGYVRHKCDEKRDNRNSDNS